MFQCSVQTDEGTIVPSLISGRTIILVSGEVKCIRIFTGDDRLTCADINSIASARFVYDEDKHSLYIDRCCFREIVANEL